MVDMVVWIWQVWALAGLGALVLDQVMCLVYYTLGPPALRQATKAVWTATWGSGATNGRRMLNLVTTCGLFPLTLWSHIKCLMLWAAGADWE